MPIYVMRPAGKAPRSCPMVKRILNCNAPKLPDCMAAKRNSLTQAHLTSDQEDPLSRNKSSAPACDRDVDAWPIVRDFRVRVPVCCFGSR